MKKSVFIILLLFWGNTSDAQSFKSVHGEASFFSSAPLEDIKARNINASSLFNAGTGAVAFVVPIKDFQFRKSLMRQHFNENYMESGKFPSATFEGKLTGYDLGISGKQEAVAEGNMSIHGITKKVQITGDFTYKSGKLKLEAQFPVKLEDYDITIPKVLFHNIAEVVEVSVLFDYEELK